MRQFKFSNNPQFVTQLRDVIGLYVNTPDNAIVHNVDEKGQILTLERSRPGPVRRSRKGAPAP